VAGSCEQGNESSVSIKDGIILDQLSKCELLKKGSSPWGSSLLHIDLLMGIFQGD
jgi:hypothetical protein